MSHSLTLAEARSKTLIGSKYAITTLLLSIMMFIPPKQLLLSDRREGPVIISTNSRNYIPQFQLGNFLSNLFDTASVWNGGWKRANTRVLWLPAAVESPSSALTGVFNGKSGGCNKRLVTGPQQSTHHAPGGQKKANNYAGQFVY